MLNRKREKSVWDAKTKFNPHLPQLVLIDAFPEIHRKSWSVRELAHSAVADLGAGARGLS